ncbi:hypothetical protein OEG84_25000 [Hoeflea sp. G2-23]|uniref:Transmembrane protein n=1 Tax=Hoeflea algicola TaxID=2983763 RepID=A0ABT3ZGC8_9HYPH|nr:hypothetical protein [Hoeflea algicola]MCY0146149.1 hypothetical protein [Hoeflea algicola]MCY0150866.1 hypothetical protein [Hoeflea algicola]
MDINIPTGAAILLDFIRNTETGTAGSESYRTIYGHNQKHLKKPITDMTLLEIQRAQMGWSKRFGSSATGGYQFMYKTLGGLIEELKISVKLKLTADLQDRLGYHLLKRRGYLAYMDGRIDAVEFAKRLAMEWASFPVLQDTKGAHRTVKRGQSFYAGDGLNKALVDPAEIERVLARVKTATNKRIPTPAPKPDIAPPADPENLDKPIAKSKTFWMWLSTAIGTPLAAFSGMDWRVQLALVAVIVGFAIYGIYARHRLAKIYREIKAGL